MKGVAGWQAEPKEKKKILTEICKISADGFSGRKPVMEGCS